MTVLVTGHQGQRGIQVHLHARIERRDHGHLLDRQPLGLAHARHELLPAAGRTPRADPRPADQPTARTPAMRRSSVRLMAASPARPASRRDRGDSREPSGRHAHAASRRPALEEGAAPGTSGSGGRCTRRATSGPRRADGPTRRPAARGRGRGDAVAADTRSSTTACSCAFTGWSLAPTACPDHSVRPASWLPAGGVWAGGVVFYGIRPVCEGLGVISLAAHRRVSGLNTSSPFRRRSRACRKSTCGRHPSSSRARRLT